jgi:SAM-dependent methyltransferase
VRILRSVPPREFVEGARPPGKTARLLQRLVLERRYGMPTGALRDLDLADIGFDAPGRVREHIPSPRGVLRRILRTNEITSDDVFIDIGCGMGPVLVEAAARYEFSRVIGIDVVPEFTEVARATIAGGRRRLRCQEIEVVTTDAMDYEFPDEVTVVYMFDLFREHIFDAVIAKLVASVDRNPRRLRIIYYLPVEGGRLERTGMARLVRYGRRRNRPWTTSPDLAMYEIQPSGDGAGSRMRLSPALPTRLRRRLLPERRLDGRSSSDGSPEPHSAGEATVQITSNGSSAGSRLVSVGSPQELRSLRAAFELHHCVRLPGFLSGPLLGRIQRYVDEAEFSARGHEGIRTELCMERGNAVELLLLLTNDPRLFELVRTITGCKRIGRFDGGIYRMMPGHEHEEPWHGEIFGHGMVEMSIDLSARLYSGGALEIRDRYSQEILHSEVDTAPGDALLSRLAPSVQRRITAVEGDSPRTVYTGRFMLFKTGSDSKLVRLGAHR